MNLSSITVTAKQIPDLSDVEEQLLTQSFYYGSRFVQSGVSVLTAGTDFFILYKNIYPARDVLYWGIGTGNNLNLVYRGLGFHTSLDKENALVKAFYHLGVEL